MCIFMEYHSVSLIYIYITYTYLIGKTYQIKDAEKLSSINMKNKIISNAVMKGKKTMKYGASNNNASAGFDGLRKKGAEHLGR